MPDRARWINKGGDVADDEPPFVRLPQRPAQDQPDHPVEPTQPAAPPDGPPPTGTDGPPSATRRRAAELIAAGENSSVEFKETAFWDVRRNIKDKVVSLALVKTIAGFMNPAGGTLLIGVNDQGEVVGLGRDYQIWGKGPRHARHAFENALTTLFEETIGRPATIRHLTVSWEQVDGHEICRLDATPSRDPVFVKNKETKATDFYVRMNNSTRALTTEDALVYITGRRASASTPR